MTIRSTAACCAAISAAALVWGISPAPARALAPIDGYGRLSDEERVSYRAHPLRDAKVRARPRPAARVIAHLHLATELGSPELYLVLSRRRASRGDDWLLIRLPMRPNGTMGWVRESALGSLHRVRTQLVIVRSKLRASLYFRGHLVWRADVGIGASGTETPKGRFYIREGLRLGDPGGPYGAYAFGTSAYSPELTDWPDGGVVGIHGTDQPELIPGRISHGCIRVTNSKIRKLHKKMPLGTPVWIR
jgi:L,D-transpeptidase catalytic domain